MAKIFLAMATLALLFPAVGSSLWNARANGYVTLTNSTVSRVTNRIRNGDNKAENPADDSQVRFEPGAAIHRSAGHWETQGLVEPDTVPQPGEYPSTEERGVYTQSAGLVISATFDSSIITNSNSAAIEATINQAISLFESQINTPVNVSILFRYSSAEPNGDPFGQSVSTSNFTTYQIPWNAFITALRGSAASENDALANANLPAAPISANIVCSSANGRGLGLDTPPGLLPNGQFQSGATYDGIVTLNSAAPFQFGRTDGAVANHNYDAQRFIEHEIDEVLGLGSYLNLGGSDLRPQDLFSWTSAGARNINVTGTRYFSIDGGVHEIVAFNQEPNFDFGDWLSTACPDEVWRVQDALGCEGQAVDMAANTPEGITLDVIGYNAVPPDFSLSLNTSKVTANPATKVPISVAINRTSGFSGAVTVTPPTIQPGLKVVGAEQSTTGASLNYTVKVKASAKAGTYILTFSGSDAAGQMATSELTLVVK